MVQDMLQVFDLLVAESLTKSLAAVTYFYHPPVGVGPRPSRIQPLVFPSMGGDVSKQRDQWPSGGSDGRKGRAHNYSQEAASISGILSPCCCPDSTRDHERHSDVSFGVLHSVPCCHTPRPGKRPCSVSTHWSLAGLGSLVTAFSGLHMSQSIYINVLT